MVISPDRERPSNVAGADVTLPMIRRQFGHISITLTYRGKHPLGAIGNDPAGTGPYGRLHQAERIIALVHAR